MKYVNLLIFVLFGFLGVYAQNNCNEAINSGGIYQQQNGISHTVTIGMPIAGEGIAQDGSFSVCNGFVPLGCSSCANSSGSTSNQLQQLCEGEQAVLFTQNVVVADGREHGYILHNGDLNIIDEIILEVSQTSTSIGIFEYNNNYPFNAQLFMSAITGLVNADGTFNIDDDCTSIDLPGTPIIFLIQDANCADEDGNAGTYNDNCNCIVTTTTCVPGTMCEGGGVYDDNCECQISPVDEECQCANGFTRGIVSESVPSSQSIGQETGIYFLVGMPTVEMPENPTNGQILIIGAANPNAQLTFNQDFVFQGANYNEGIYPLSFFNDNVVIFIYNEDAGVWQFSESLLDACSCCIGINTISVNQTESEIDKVLNSDSQIVLTYGAAVVELPALPTSAQLILIEADNSNAEIIFNNDFIFNGMSYAAGGSYALSFFGNENSILLIYDSFTQKWIVRKETSTTDFNFDSCMQSCTSTNSSGELSLYANRPTYGCLYDPVIVISQNAVIPAGEELAFLLHNQSQTIFYDYYDEGTIATFIYDGLNYPTNEPLYISSVVGLPSNEIFYTTNASGVQTAVSGLLPDINDICTSITLLSTPVTFYELDCNNECNGGNPCPTCNDPAACNIGEESICFFIGDACNDGNANTGNDMYNADCDCVGELIETCDVELFDVPVFDFNYTNFCKAIGISFQMFDFCEQSCCEEGIDVEGFYSAYIENELVFSDTYTFSNLCGSFNFTNNLSSVQFCNSDLFNGAKVYVKVTVSDINSDCNLVGNIIGTYISSTKTITEDDLLSCVQSCYEENYNICAQTCNRDICAGDLEISSNIDGICSCNPVIEQAQAECNNPDACVYNEDANCVNNNLCDFSDPNFNCEGNCIVELDCDDVCGGSATLDCNGVCNGSALEGVGCDDNNPITFDDTYNSDCTCAGSEGIFDLALETELLTNDSFNQGDEISIRIVVTNEGEIDAENINIINYIPDGLTLNSPNWNLNNNGNATFMLFESIPPGGNQITTINFIINESAGGVIITNITEILSAENELGNSGNDIDSSYDSDPNNDSSNEDDIDEVEIITEEVVLANIAIVIEKLLDTNCDGLADESGMGWLFQLYNNDTNTTLPAEITGINGELSFNNLAEGTYTISEVNQSGWIPISPSNAEITITVEANNTYEYKFISSPSDLSNCITYATPDCNCPSED